ncbi:MAG: hypothetical protein ACOX56_04915 [Acholeplasmataceae bacterium]|jgi:uncharacterized membrane protein YczE
MKNDKPFIIRLIIHVFGASLVGFGVQVIIYSQMGSAPLDAFNYYTARLYLQAVGKLDDGIILNLVGITSFIYGTLITIIVFLIKRDKKLFISWIHLTFVAFTIFLWGFLFKIFTPLGDNMALKILFGVLGIILIALGTALTLQTGLPSGPYEQLMLLIDSKINHLFVSKLILELFNLGLAFICMVISVRVISNEPLEFTQIGLFTVFNLLLTSYLIAFFSSMYQKIFNKSKEELMVDE